MSLLLLLLEPLSLAWQQQQQLGCTIIGAGLRRCTGIVGFLYDYQHMQWTHQALRSVADIRQLYA